ncbi:MAG TPA: YceI family protein, partial [Candidatus Limnocylindria bacterium]|nr:YceI family protein [Candidatus Limnocylindria bacterium]
FVVDGDLTIRATTKPVSVDVELVGIAADPRAGQRAGFDATFSFDRTQWGLVWNMPIPSGVLVGEKISVEANIAATPQVKGIEAVAA